LFTTTEEEGLVTFKSDGGKIIRMNIKRTQKSGIPISRENGKHHLLDKKGKHVWIGFVVA
jgi:hypothetical protein